MLKRWAANIGAVLAWLLIAVLAMVVLMVGSSLYQVFLRVTLQVSRWSNTLWVDLYFVFSGLLWLGLVIFTEHLLFNPSARAGLLVPRALYICGFEIVLIALIQIGLNAYGTFGWFDILMIALELLVGGLMIWFARRKPRAGIKS